MKLSTKSNKIPIQWSASFKLTKNCSHSLWPTPRKLNAYVIAISNTIAWNAWPKIHSFPFHNSGFLCKWRSSTTPLKKLIKARLFPCACSVRIYQNKFSILLQKKENQAIQILFSRAVILPRPSSSTHTNRAMSYQLIWRHRSKILWLLTARGFRLIRWSQV